MLNVIHIRLISQLLVHLARGGAAGSGGVALGTPAQVNGQCLTLDAGAALLSVDADQTVGLGVELFLQGDDDALGNIVLT